MFPIIPSSWLQERFRQALNAFKDSTKFCPNASALNAAGDFACKSWENLERRSIDFIRGNVGGPIHKCNSLSEHIGYMAAEISHLRESREVLYDSISRHRLKFIAMANEIERLTKELEKLKA